jgi:putative hydrolase of the HAD superfamily
VVKAVVFDFGGVLCRLVDYSGRGKWEEKLGLPGGRLTAVVLESAVAQQCLLGRVTEAQVWARLGEDFGLSRAELEELQGDFWSGHLLDQQLLQFLQGLRPQYRTALLSNFWQDTRKTFACTFGLEADAVDTMIISSEEGCAKPEARIYHLAARRLGVCPGEMLFVDDSPENITGAERAGARGILFESTTQVMECLGELLGVRD